MTRRRVGTLLLAAAVLTVGTACDSGASPAGTPTASATTPVPISVSVSAPSPAPASGRVVTPEQFGAVGNGTHDDTHALQRALDAAGERGTVRLKRGAVYRHTGVLRARRTGEHVVGHATLLATDPAESSFWVTADHVTVDGPTFRTAGVTKRYFAYQQMGLRLAGVRGAVIRNVTVIGSAAAGIYVGESCCTGGPRRSSHFLIENVDVRNTHADGIHMTGGSFAGTVRNATVHESGDDGIAVVSYRSDHVWVHDISVSSSRVLGTTHGRGVSVVGGANVTYDKIHISNSDAAGVYIAVEGAPFYTTAVHDVRLSNLTLTHDNTDKAVQHGAVLVYSGRKDHAISNVQLSGIRISHTPGTAPWEVGFRTGGGTISNIDANRVTITGQLPPLGTNVPRSDYTLRRWVVNGKPFG